MTFQGLKIDSTVWECMAVFSVKISHPYMHGATINVLAPPILSIHQVVHIGLVHDTVPCSVAFIMVFLGLLTVEFFS